MSSFWRTLTRGQIRLEHAGEQVAKRLNLLDDAQKVVADVAEVLGELVGHESVVSADKILDRVHERGGRLVELEHLPLEQVDALHRVDVGLREDLELHLPDVVVDAGDDGRVVVHHLVDDRVHDRGRSAGDQVGPGLDAAADVAQRAGLAVADDDDEAVADEHVDLAHLDLLGLVDVAGGLEHDEDRLVVHLELGSLVRVQSVLDGELVELELAPDDVELFVGRLVETEPDEGVLALTGCGHIGEGELTGLALPALVQRAIDGVRRGGARCTRREPPAG